MKSFNRLPHRLLRTTLSSSHSVQLNTSYLTKHTLLASARSAAPNPEAASANENESSTATNNENNSTDNQETTEHRRRLVQVPYNPFVSKYGISVDKEEQLRAKQQHTPNSSASSPDSNPETLKQFEDENLDLGAYSMDEKTLQKFVSKGPNTRKEVEKFIESENAEWGDTHWSERHYPATQNQMVLRARPSEVQNMIDESAPPVHQKGKLSIMPVQAGGPAYPIFYDPNTGMDRPQASIPKDPAAKKSRVLHIQSLHKATHLNYSECSMAYDYAQGQYTVALEQLRGKQVQRLVDETGRPREECKRVFDQCLGRYDKALRQLQIG